ncbi:MAG: M43 family zinc metalloprotease, partial [Bacteroidia bacterium]
MNNRNLLLFAALVLAWVGGTAQRVTSHAVQATKQPFLHQHEHNASEKKVRCYTMEAEARRIANNPNAETLDEFEGWLQKQMADPKVQAKARAVYNIPVIVHIIHNGTGVGSGQNLSQSQIYSQFDVLNEDFRRTNADAANTPSVFTGVGADCEINFCKATVDPSGNALTEPGIHRVNRNTAGFSAPPYSDTYLDGTIKPATSWDPTKYLNIWVCDLGQQLLGYAQFPTGSGLSGLAGGTTTANTDGVVILYSAFGRIGNVAAPYNKGRTATHEVGHWLGLRHVWGDGNCATDYVTDTPTQQQDNGGCPTFPHITCNNGPNGDMFMNYMDYTNDACMNIFTTGQKARMQTVMSVSPRRASLNASTVCNSVTPVPPVASFTYNPAQPCAGASAQFTNTSTGAPTTYTWSFPGGAPATASTQNASTTYATAGTYTVTLTVANAQGSNSTNQTIIVKDCSSSGGCDSLINITVDDTLAFYLVSAQDGGGYVTGQNGFEDKAYADFYTYTAPSNATLSDLILGFAKASAMTANAKVTARVWANSGGAPGAVLGSVDIPLSTIVSDVNA